MEIKIHFATQYLIWTMNFRTSKQFNRIKAHINNIDNN